MSLFVPGDRIYSRDAQQVDVSPVSGNDPSRLTDGRLSALWSSPTGSMALEYRVRIRLPFAATIDFVSVHDLRIEGGQTLDYMRIGGLFGHTFTPPFARSRWRGFWGRLDTPLSTPAMTEIEVMLRLSAIARIHIGEVVLGSAIRLPYDYRAATREDEPLVVENGDYRVMASAPRQTVSLDFPPSLSDDFAEIVEASGGPLQPVVVVPAEDQPDAVFGHLQPGIQRGEDLRIHTPSGVVVREAERALR